jgi:hypothetical protein
MASPLVICPTSIGPAATCQFWLSVRFSHVSYRDYHETDTALVCA